MSSSLKPLEHFHQISHGAFCQKGIANFSNGSAPSNKIAALPIYGKTLKNLLQNQENFGAESWYIASGTQGLPSLFK